MQEQEHVRILEDKIMKLTPSEDASSKQVWKGWQVPLSIYCVLWKVSDFCLRLCVLHVTEIWEHAFMDFTTCKIYITYLLAFLGLEISKPCVAWRMLKHYLIDQVAWRYA